MLEEGLRTQLRSSKFVSWLNRWSNLGRRHLVRFWLRDPECAWKTPAPLQDRWDRVYKDVAPEKSVFPLEPVIRNASLGEKSQKH